MDNQDIAHLGVVKALLLSTTVFGFVTLTDVNEWLKFVSIILAIGYCCWKWRNDYLTSKKRKK